ncbi:MAG: hypothetical protein DMF63_00015 [Acidobacteria bacterium]|nr:MAG: hypothetical protein DMF63_00015 [Acidobacteriota bacterium]
MKKNRREFLKRSGCALGMAALGSQFRHFGLMSALAQKVADDSPSSVPTDYRALVCIFMNGGNDGNNTIVPLHSSTSLSNFNDYYALRNPFNLALTQNTLLPFAVPRMGNLTYGFHPAMGAGAFSNGLYELWGQNRMAVVANVGTLVKPTTKAQYNEFSYPKPYGLYSHLDQALQYQSARSDHQIFSGWGGRLADQRTAPDNPGALVPMITSIAGAQLFTAGQTTLPMAIGPATIGLDQVLKPQGYDETPDSQAQLAALNALRSQDLSSELIAAASHVTDQAITLNNSLQSYQEVSVQFPPSGIGNQLKQVARLIKKRTDLNVRRQIFFVQINGFDTHRQQMSTHNSLMSQTSQAMRCFYDEMTAQGIADKVTQFTISDFGRTLNPAGTGSSAGSDHAWGNHHIVVGGVSSADFYGINGTNGTPFPTFTYDGPDDADTGTGARGRWIPTTAVEQYAATLARWFGLPDSALPSVFPNIGNFTSTNLGFMSAP